MKWSWKIGTFAGIDVFMHATFLLIIGFVGLTNYQSTGTWTGVLEGILLRWCCSDLSCCTSSGTP